MVRRRAGEFSVEYLVDLLLKHGLIKDEQRRLVAAREGAQRMRLAREIGTGGRRRDLSPVEVLASFDFADPRRRPEQLDQDKITQLVAQDAGVGFRRIDRLKLDGALVVRTFSLPYARKHGVIALEKSGNSLISTACSTIDHRRAAHVIKCIVRQCR